MTLEDSVLDMIARGMTPEACKQQIMSEWLEENQNEGFLLVELAVINGTFDSAKRVQKAMIEELEKCKNDPEYFYKTYWEVKSDKPNS